jgi:sulfatase modifying factor 1
VWQWAADWFSDNYYATSPASNPSGPASGSAKVLRGGTWDIDAKGVRSSVRLPFPPDSSFNEFGFRCAH